MAAAVAPVQPPPAGTAPVTRYQGVDKQSSGYKLLAAMGWREGEGLGATRQGIKEHIKVKKKFENWGVGAVEAAEKARDWTTGMMDFTRVLSTLSEITSQHAAAGDSGYDSSSEDEERRSDASDGGAAIKRAAAAAAMAAAEAKEGATAKGKQEKKKKGALKKQAKAAEDEAGSGEKKSKRKKANKAKKKKKGAAAAEAAAAAGSSDSESGSNAGSDGSDSDSDASGAAAEAPAPKRVKFATHVGRFKRREAAKMVKNYSSTDLEAILGGGGGAAAAPAVELPSGLVEVRAERPAESSDSEGDSGDEGRGAPAPSTSGQASGQACSSEPDAPAVLPEDEGKWWAGYFGRAAVCAGTGAGASGRPVITIHGFREQDQENLYNMAQDGRTQGRVGLGRSSMPKKVAGARWAGKKTKLGSDSEEEEEAEAGAEGQAAAQQQGAAAGGEAAQQPGEVHLGNGVVVILPPSKQGLLAELLGSGKGKQAAQQQQPAAQSKQKKKGGKKGQQQGAASSRGSSEAAQPAPAEQAAAAAAGGGADALAGLKWRKLVLAQLKASGKSKLSVSKLSKAIVKERGLGKAARAQVEQLVSQAAGASSKLALQDGVVRLSAGQ